MIFISLWLPLLPTAAAKQNPSEEISTHLTNPGTSPISLDESAESD